MKKLIYIIIAALSLVIVPLLWRIANYVYEYFHPRWEMRPPR